MKKIVLTLCVLAMGYGLVAAQSQIEGNLNPNINVGLEIGLPCSPASVSNGSVNPQTCAITCNSGYNLQGQQCIQQSSGGGGGGGGGGGCAITTVANGIVDFACSIVCNPGYTLENNACILDALSNTGVGGSTGPVTGGPAVDLPLLTTRSGIPYGGDGACSDPEYNLAYSFAFHHSITTMPTCLVADMDGWLIRSHASKMISNYAMNVLGKTPDLDKVCEFDDMANESEEMQSFAVMACRLGIMGLEADGVTSAQSFNPQQYLHKAHFATMLSRLLFGSTYDGNYECRYCDHVDKMVEDGVITVVTDLFDPLRRGFAMIMLMRTAQE